MRIFLGECVDWRLARDIAGHEVKTARQVGWITIKNGELLGLPDRGLAAAGPAHQHHDHGFGAVASTA